VVAVVAFAIAWARSRGERSTLARQIDRERAETDAVRAALDERRKSHPYSESDRSRALVGSRASRGGEAAEQIAPLLPGYPFDPHDVRYLGGRFDQIAFVKHEGKLWIVFIEIKSGGSGFDPRQNEACDAIRNGRISWHLIRVLEGNEGARCVSKRRGRVQGALGTRHYLSGRASAAPTLATRHHRGGNISLSPPGHRPTIRTRLGFVEK